MDFFEHQIQAHRRTRLLLLLMGLAVLAISSSLYLVFSLLQGYTSEVFVFLGPVSFFKIFGGTLAVVLLASFGRTLILKRIGGQGVAEMLGGRLLSPQTDDEHERRLINVVEEMSIASGVPLPKIYVLDKELAINAFAAGYETNDAVVAVTRGTLEQLSRDELQGVIAHEYSHILNGDMNINLKLMGVLFGILLIALAGRFLLRISLYSRGRSRSRDAGSAKLVMVLLGVVLFIVGYLGHFFARLIQAAVSRQREFLADASAVQFTRNPEGIAGALQKIATVPTQSKLTHARAAEASHFYFGDGLRLNLGGWLSTHPPIAERIKRIDKNLLQKSAVEHTKAQGMPQTKGMAHAAGFAGVSQASLQKELPEPKDALATASVRPPDYQQADRMIGNLPPALIALAHEPFSACALLFSLLLSSEHELGRNQHSYLRQNFHPQIDEELAQLPSFGSLDAVQKITLIELAGGSLRHLSKEQQHRALQAVDWLVRSDGRINLLEVLLAHTMRRHLYSSACIKKGKGLSFAALLEECSVVFSVLAHAGSRERGAQQSAFDAGLAYLSQSQAKRSAQLHFIPPSEHSLSALGAALDVLSAADPNTARLIHHASYQVLMSDGKMNDAERVLFVALNQALGIPVPATAFNVPRVQS
ncbi:MAG: M48 family metallopeptidase [Myxococcales bacterium]|nr:MAG: M48 family metallopeptidase [Myxococcales bacterium]